jgi:endonuclease YncB( thermonuclease family)
LLTPSWTLDRRGHVQLYGIKVRLRGIDAPEIGTPDGFEAAQRLASLLREGAVTIVPVSHDVYGRTVADVFLNGQNLADLLTAEGYDRRE